MNILQYENYQKKEIPADPDFPYQTYPCSIPLDFTEVPLHWHDEMEIVYIKKGCGLLSVDFNYYQVKEKDIILILPGQLHSIKQDGTAMMEYENIIFRLDMLYARQSDICTEQYFLPLTRHQIHVPVHLTPESSGYEQVAAHLDAIDLIRSSFPPAFELFIKGRLFELFYVLISASAKPDAVSYTHQNQINKTREILKYIEQHYGEKVSIAAIAKTVGFSESHFMKFFKSALGTSFIAYLNDYRLTMASRLLLASDSTILEIAEDTGFDNLSYFNRMFKKKFGTTPSTFRKEH